MPGRNGRKKPLQLIEDLVNIGTPELMNQADMGEPKARELMRTIAYQFCAMNGKSTIYIPAAIESELAERDRQIWVAYGEHGADGTRAYTGERVQQIAIQHELTTQQVYNIIRLAKRHAARSV